MTDRHTFLAGCCWLLVCSTGLSADYASVSVDPALLTLEGPTASYSLLVEGLTGDGRAVDLTHEARYRSADPRIAEVSPTGVVRSKKDGQTKIQIEAGGRTLTVEVRSQGTSKQRHITYSSDVLPIFSRFGCNASACHGKAEGQNGFKLSVFGSDPAADLVALTQEARGRRIFPAAPEQSLILRKMSGQMPHGGGARIPRTSPDYETVRAWIAAGTPLSSPEDPVVESVRVEPAERLLQPRQLQQLRVVAHYRDGREVDVTALARFQSNNDDLVNVPASGLMQAGDIPGEAAVMASFKNETAFCRVIVPRAEKIEPYPNLPSNNFIDRLVFAKLRKLNLLPSDLADDAEYLRRVYLDLIGTLPDAEEARRFLADQRPDKRARIVEELLERPEFADYWALQWADLLRVDRGVLGHKRAYAYYRWIRDRIAANAPLDRLAREVLTAEGPLQEAARRRSTGWSANRARWPAPCRRSSWECASPVPSAIIILSTAGARIDYYGMQAFFTRRGDPQRSAGRVAAGGGTGHSPQSAQPADHPGFSAGGADPLGSGDRLRGLTPPARRAWPWPIG